jgi:hypothetical protein
MRSEAAARRRCILGAEVVRSAAYASSERADIWIEDGRIVGVTAPDAAPTPAACSLFPV